MKKKIVQINAVYEQGSTGRIARELHKWFLSNDIDSWVFASDGAQNKFSKKKSSYEPGVYGFGSSFDYKLHALGARITGHQANGSRFATKNILKRLEMIKPDIVILHNLHGNYVNLKLLLQWLSKNNTPTIVYLHDCWFFTGKCSHYTTIGCDKWQFSCGNCPKLKDDIPSWFFDKTSVMLAEKRKLFTSIPSLGVVGVSDWVLEQSQLGLLNCAKHKKRIYNWIDLEKFKPCGDSFKKDHNIYNQMVLCVASGWGENDKKTFHLRKLASKLDKDKTLVVVGNASDSTLPKQVVHIPLISDERMLAAVYSAADVYVHLSEEDTFGKVIAESLACGTPVVSFDSTAYPELVTTDCGIIVPVGDVKALKKGIDVVLSKDKNKDFNCRKQAEVRFDKKKLIPELYEFMKLVCKDK